MQNFAFYNAWEVSAQAEPEAWVTFFLPTCVSVSKTTLIMFPEMVMQRQCWEPAGDFCSKLPLNWTILVVWYQDFLRSWWDVEDPQLLAQRPSESQSWWRSVALNDFPGHCWFVARLFVCKFSVCHAMASPLLLTAAFAMINLDVTCGIDCATSLIWSGRGINLVKKREKFYFHTNPLGSRNGG